MNHSKEINSLRRQLPRELFLEITRKRDYTFVWVTVEDFRQECVEKLQDYCNETEREGVALAFPDRGVVKNLASILHEARQLAKPRAIKKRYCDVVSYFLRNKATGRPGQVYRRGRYGRYDSHPEKRSLAAKLEIRRADLIRKVAQESLHCFNSMSKTPIRIIGSKDFDQAGIKTVESMEYKSARRRCKPMLKKHYRISPSRGYLTIPEWARVVDGSVIIGGIRETSAEKKGELIYRVRYAKKIIGGYETEQGYVVRKDIDGVTYTALGKSARGARANCARKTPEYLAGSEDREARRKASLARYNASIEPLIKRLPVQIDMNQMLGLSN